MKSAHAHLNITRQEWQAMLADFGKALDKFKIPAREQKELVAIVNSTRSDMFTTIDKRPDHFSLDEGK